METKPKNRVLRQPEVSKRTGIPRSSLYILIKEKKFKAPILLGKRSVGWLESDVDEFIAERIKASRPESK